MSDYQKIVKNVVDFKSFLVDMHSLFDDLNKKINNKQLEYFFLERILIFSLHSKKHRFFILSLILKHFRIKVSILSIFNLFLRKVKSKFKP